MKKTNVLKLPQTVRRVFDRYRRRWRALGAFSGLLLSISILVGTIGAAVVADRLFRLASTPRAVFLIAILGTFAFFIVRWVIFRIARRMRYRQVAFRLGRHFPNMQEDLVTAVELGSMSADQQGVSRSLVDSALQQIEGRTEKLDYRAAVSFRPLLQAAVVFLILAGTLELMHLIRPEAVQNALTRLFRPNSQVPFFCYTKLNVLSGNQVIANGQTAEVTVEMSGKYPSTARLEAQNGGGLLRVNLDCAGNTAHWRSGPLFEDFDYRVLAGDAISDWYRIRVVPPPALQSKSALLRYPEYTGVQEQIAESIEGPLEIVPGTAVTIRALPVFRGEEAGFRCSGELTAGDVHLTLKPDNSGLLCSEMFKPTDSAEYTIRLTDGFGLKNSSAESLSIRVISDRLPQVIITSPNRDVLALPGEKVLVAASAEDEFGLRLLGLDHRTLKGGLDGAGSGFWQVRKLKEGGATVRKLQAEAALNLEEMGLVPGDVLEYRATSSDYADQASFRRAYSRQYRVIVLSEAEHLERVFAELRQFQIELLRLAAEQERKATQAAGLAEKAQEASVSDQASEVQSQEAQLAESTKALAGEIESLIAELMRNPSSPLSTMVDLEKLGRSVRSVAENPMASMQQSLGQAAQAQQGQQSSQLEKAQEFGKTAAKQLRDLARLAEQTQWRGILEKLAIEAERLAAQQRELGKTTIPLARRTAGSNIGQLEEELRHSVQQLSATQESIKTGVDSLAGEIAEAVGTLSFSDPAAADVAEQAREKLEFEKVSAAADKIVKQMGQNILFSGLDAQESVAKSLTEVAEVLRRSAQADPVKALVERLEEFIGQQTQINSNIQAAISGAEGAKTAGAMGTKQSDLQREVSEHALALQWLAREIENFHSETVDKLSAAGEEMKAGSNRLLYESALAEGLRHGEKALEHLLSAREKLEGELAQMGQAAQGMQSMRALLLLQRIILGQKAVNKGTAGADKIREQSPEVFSERTAKLAKTQGTLRLEAERLQEMLARFAQAAQLVDQAGQKMETSRFALEVGETGRDARVVQEEVVALLESLIKQQMASMAQGQAGALAMARMQAMMQMMQMMGQGMNPGGYRGGENAPILPGSVAQAGDQHWRMVRSRFEDELGADFEAQYPSEFRALLDAYFDRLRKEPPR